MERELKYTTNNGILTKAYKAYITLTENQFRQKQVEVEQGEIETVKAIQEHLKRELSDNWRPQQKVNEMQQAIDRALKNTYNNFFNENNKRKKQIRKEFLQETTWTEIQTKNIMWAKVREWWKKKG